MKRFLLFFLILIGVAVGGWWLGRQSHSHSGSGVSAGERHPLFYQSPMHPWIKSDKPGQCTICGMDLVPVYESAQSLDGAAKDVVILPAGSPRVAGIASAPAQRMPLVRTLRVAGMVDDDATRHRFLSATIKGRVDKLYVNFVGAEVEEGEPLAEFFSRELLAAISEYNQAGGDGGFRQAASFKLRQMGLAEKQIAELGKRDPKSLTVQILAPVSGTVVAQDVFEGKWVEEGEKMLEIADFRKMWFKFDAYERDLPWLKLGQEVEIRTPSHPGRVFKAPITFIDPNLDEITRTAKVRVELDNPLFEENGRMRRTFLHRLFAEATVQIAAPEALTVPRAAVLWPGGQPRVFVDEGDGAFRLRRVTLGREGDTHLEITSGLTAGEKVVVRGGVLLDGQAQLLNNYEEPVADAPAPVVSAAGLCPVSGEKLGSMGKPFNLTHEGRDIPLCCKACKKDFEADPAKYLAKLDAAGTEPAPLPPVTPAPPGASACPVSGEKLGSMGKPFVFTHQGRDVQLCCKACKPDFEAEPARYLPKVGNS
jgi:Cu(I)/Ag(I) efflux system membrane fusion protein